MNELADFPLYEKLDAIQQMTTVEEVLEELRKIKGLKEVLKSLGTFKQQSIKFAKLHAETLIRVVELGGIDELQGVARKVAQWLYDCTWEEREQYIDMCEEGMTIENVWKREVKDVQQMNYAINSANEGRKEVINTVKKEGIVDITEYIENVYKLISEKDLARDLVDGTRNRLKTSGAIGVGDDSHLYVMPNSGNKAEIKRALIMRYESICNDFNKISEICAISKVKMYYSDFEPDFYYANWNPKNCWMPHVLLALARMGLVEEEPLADVIARSDFAKEVDAAKNHLGISREKFIESEYLVIQNRRSSAQGQ